MKYNKYFFIIIVIVIVICYFNYIEQFTKQSTVLYTEIPSSTTGFFKDTITKWI